jgi:hypothetical protein
MSIQDFENSLGGEGDAQPEVRKGDDEALAIAFVDQTSGVIADYVTKSLIDLLNALGPETIAAMDPETLNSYLMEKGEQASEDATAAAIANYGTYSSGYTPGLAGTKEFDCVRKSDVPVEYNSNTKMSLLTGACAVEY